MADSGKSLELVSIVVPVYNEEAVIVEFNRRLSTVRQQLATASEVIYVNDGSKDGSLNLLRALRAADPTVGIVDLSRNFGKEVALTAGIATTPAAALSSSSTPISKTLPS